MTPFFRPDGSPGAVITDGTQYHGGLTPIAKGFLLYSNGSWQTRNCQFIRKLDPDGRPIQASWNDPNIGLTPNPTGGFIESRHKSDYQTPPHDAFEFRWVNGDRQPLGDWHTALSWTIDPSPNGQLTVLIDRLGRVLVLSLLYPETFGAPAPPSTWKFSARWMGPDGPLGDAFEPVSPKWMVNGKVVSFTGWGKMLPLPKGGFAAYFDPTPSRGGSPSPSGWYARYPDGESRTSAAPDWL